MFLNIVASIDIMFYLILGIAIFFGFLRGFRKSIFNFIVMAIFYIIFFLTLNTAVHMVWSMNLSFLGNILGNIDANLSSFQSFENDYQLIIQTFFNDSFDFTQSEMDLLAIGIIQFVIKILWSIVYFTVILLLYKIITGIIRIIFVKARKPKRRLLGSVVGVLNGAMAVFVTLIVLGGTVSFIDSVSLLLDNETDETTNTLVFEPRTSIVELNNPLISDNQVVELAEEDPLVDPAMQETLNDLVDNYHSNIIVKIANTIKVDSSFNATEKVPLHIDLFDRVLSFKYDESDIALRHELSVFMNAFKVIQDSEYGETQKITDIKGEDIRLAFTYLESSILLPTALPVGIKYYSNVNEIDLSVSDSELFDYDYTEEISRLSNILAGVFDILNEQETSIDEDGNQVNIDGDWVKDIFNDVSQSRVVLLATEALLVPMIEDGESAITQIIALPSQISWENEYLALGNILAEMVDSGISIQDIEAADFNLVLETFSNIDSSVLLDSQLITEGLINILSGDTTMEGLEILTVPDNITWRSSDTETGELEYILVAIQSLMNEMDSLDFSNVDIDLLTSFDETTLSAILDSYIIRATISDQMSTFELGTYQLLIPDNTKDSKGYFTKTELQAIIESIQLLTDVDGFSIEALYTMSDTDLDLLFSSKIIQATISDIILDQATTTPGSSFSLVVPTIFREEILVNSQSLEQIEVTELKAIINSLNTLNMTNFNGAIDAGVVTSLSSNDLNTILESGALHISIGHMIKENGLIVIPDFSVEDLYGFTDVVIKAEVVHFILAINELDENDFTNANFNFSAIAALDANQQSTILDSSIVRSTISEDVENARSVWNATNPLDQYHSPWEYESDNETLTKASIIGFINHRDS
ncbi:hypothetical protein KHQ88_03715 [Mycoplasmatota bacterium]|nr:hypothetical protein KHQ88_03715 [Mycoplasmatota bacterium]